MLTMTSLTLVALFALQAPQDVRAWIFSNPADVKAWVANGHLANVTVKDGAVSADAVEWDPFWHCTGLEVKASPWQFILLRLKASRPGRGEVFWSGQTTGKYGGLSQDKCAPFHLRGDGTWEEVVIFPFWQADGTIRQIRLDVYEGAHFDLSSIRILEWGAGKPPQTDVFSWEFKGDPSAWRVHSAADTLFAPRLRLPVADKGWVSVQLRSDKDSTAAIVWSTADGEGMKSHDFAIRGGNQSRCYNIELAGLREWHDPVVAFGIRPSPEAKTVLESIRIASEPSGPPEIVVSYLGFENGVNRAGRPCRVLAQFTNRGGSKAEGLKARLVLAGKARFVDGPCEQPIPTLDYSDQVELAWTVQSASEGDCNVVLATEGPGAAEPVETSLRFLPAINLPAAAYVPEPRPIRTELDVLMYYFPGWDSDAKWDCIRRVAPIRKPLLGYYDEANPECVDWQIKWAAENGVTGYLVDWYWVGGSKHLEHWFEAYKKARYRKHLKVAIMWANHNPPNTHSRDDWRKVTREWIDRYFPLDSYYQIDGKPAVFIWAPTNVRHDLKGSAEVAAAFKESQEMARAAGFPGITFVAMSGHESAAGVKALLEEGYFGATNYHEWGNATGLSKNPNRADYGDIAKTVRKAWEEKVARCGRLVYYPVVDTGWDSRPWHGDKSLVIGGRTPDRFEDILRQAKAYCMQTGRSLVILGPANEWGEGSYVEPNNEFGFEMMERIRRVFGMGNPAAWPINLGPTDVGGGPYDFPHQPRVSRWTFERSVEGWNAMMGVAGFGQKDGALRFRTTTHDPAIMTNAQGLRAREFTTLVIRMRIAGTLQPGDHGQLFFSVGGEAMTEATTYGFGLVNDGQVHDYRIDLCTNPRWRSRITALRLDPCSSKDVEVVIEEIRFE
jgi:hypothetical protein